MKLPLITVTIFLSSVIETAALEAKGRDERSPRSPSSRFSEDMVPPSSSYEPKAKFKPNYNLSLFENERYWGTMYISPDVLTTDDLTVFNGNIKFVEESCRIVWVEVEWVDLIVNVFEVLFTDGTIVQAWVDSEYTVNEAEEQINKMFPSWGRIPYFLREETSAIAIIRRGDGLSAGSRVINVHEGRFNNILSDGFAEEGWIHGKFSFLIFVLFFLPYLTRQQTSSFLAHFIEGTHLSVDSQTYNTQAWNAAVSSDNEFISDYAASNSGTEDVSESIGAWFPVTHKRDRLEPSDVTKIEEMIPNRLNYFDNQEWSGSDLYPVSGENPNSSKDWVSPPWNMICSTPLTEIPDPNCNSSKEKEKCNTIVGCAWNKKKILRNRGICKNALVQENASSKSKKESAMKKVVFGKKIIAKVDGMTCAPIKMKAVRTGHPTGNVA
eukprot:CAMPEP_0171302398 /NCGR_PEP_ID=MMETSP0816-20121228/11765_1 /TAXON_ID=420281 /ORGANISM="Proboscia inermis, Strain CCAP1064/1" /LENGTH=437 /DNA_ID=CAMNT_0011780819 /DNA_START=156 /DNA_END=1470 /DNA_ORIENTATION=+